MCRYSAHLLLGQVIRQVGNHDLGLGGNTVSGGTTLTALAGGASLVLGSLFVLVSCCVLVGDVLEWLDLSSGVRISSSGSLGISSPSFALLLLLAGLLYMVG